MDLRAENPKACVYRSWEIITPTCCGVYITSFLTCGKNIIDGRSVTLFLADFSTLIFV